MQPDLDRKNSDFDPNLDELALDALVADGPFMPLPDNFVERTMLLIREEAQQEIQTFRLHWTDFVYPLGIAAMGTSLLLTVQLMLMNYYAKSGNWELAPLGLENMPISVPAGLSIGGCALLCCFWFYLNRK